MLFLDYPIECIFTTDPVSAVARRLAGMLAGIVSSEEPLIRLTQWTNTTTSRRRGSLYFGGAGNRRDVDIKNEGAEAAKLDTNRGRATPI